MFFKAAREHLHKWTNSLVGVQRLTAIGVRPEDAQRIVSEFHEWAVEQLAQETPNIMSAWFTNEYSWAMQSMDDFVPALDLMITRRMVVWASQLYEYRSSNGLDCWPGLDIVARLRQAADLKHQAEHFADARRIHRKIIMHVGPTNSGKTYNALRALAAANRGVYAGPLRLLAHEVYSRLNAGSILPAGIERDPADPDKPHPRVCNMITGEEKRVIAEDAPLTSCTVEMLSFVTHFDVAVVDEIQMIGDRDRGGGWTAAVLGLMADELHLCGEASAVPIIEAMCKETGDELVVHNYERLSPLKSASNSLESDLSQLREGDCVVAFSRNRIYAVKQQIENTTSFKCAVAYGMLPPELRAQQAALFNEPGNEYGVMVASDAIGMGLNLCVCFSLTVRCPLIGCLCRKIKRVIFDSTQKWDGTQMTPLSLSTMKQIAGRAGRFTLGDTVPPGIATTMQPQNLEDLQLALRLPTRPLKRAIITPSKDQLFALLQLMPRDAMPSHVLRLLPYFAQLPRHFTLSNMVALAELSELIESFGTGPLSATEYWTLIMAPINRKDFNITSAASTLLEQYQTTSQTNLREMLHTIDLLEAFTHIRGLRQRYEAMDAAARQAAGPPSTPGELLRKLEATHRILILYLWLSYRLPVAFHEQPLAFEMKEELELCIAFFLRELRPHTGRAPPRPMGDGGGRRRARDHGHPSPQTFELPPAAELASVRPIAAVA